MVFRSLRWLFILTHRFAPRRRFAPQDFLKIEEAVGFVSDIQREWRIPVYIGLSPGALGHDPDADNSEVIKKVRTDFVSNTLPKYLTFL